MTTMERGQELHSRAAQGETLSHDEQAELDAWLKVQERVEIEELLMNGPVDTRTLQAEIAAALKQIRQMALNIEQVHAENEQIRHENSILRRRIARPVAA